MDLISHLKASGVLRTPRIIRAFRHVPRINFLPEHLRQFEEADTALPIGYGATISQPYTVAFMLEQLQPKPGEKILDIGSGSGWTTALLASIVGKRGQVFGLEIVPELAAIGQENVNRTGFHNLTILAKSGAAGLKAEAPFDGILVSAAAPRVEAALLEQLKVGGRLVIPIDDARGARLERYKKTRSGSTKQEFEGFVFVPLQGST